MSLNGIQLCRVCLVQDGPMRFINVEEQHPIPHFAQFFTMLTSLRVERDNDLTSRICQKCSNRVFDAYKLRDLALASDSYLRFRRSQEQNLPLEADDFPDDPSEKINNNYITNILEDTLPKLSIQEHTCPTCFKKFKYESEMQRHQNTHTPKFNCAICNKVFGFKSSLLRHEKQHSRGGARRPCPHCRSTFRDEALLRRHVQYAHKEKKHACGTCDARFGSPSALRAHSRSHAAKALRCRRCGRAFSLRHQLARHEAAHDGAGKHFCDDCGKGFIQKHHLEAHAASHRPEQRVACPSDGCGKLFATKYALGRHVDVVHSKDRLLCSSCGERFASLRRLEKHAARCEPGAPQSPPSQKSTCHTCKKVFNKKYLKKHQLTCCEIGLEAPENATKDATKAEEIQNDDTNLVRIVEDVANMMDRQEETTKLSLQITQINVEEFRPQCNDFRCNEDPTKTAFEDHSDTIVKCSPERLVTNIEEVLKSGCSDCSDCCQTDANPNSFPNDSNEGMLNVLNSVCSQNFGEPRDACSPNMAVQTNADDVFNNDCATHTSCQSFTKETNQSVMRVKLDIRDDAQANDCKGILGKCIMTSTDGSGEECICAKVGHGEAPLPEYLTTPLLVALQEQGYCPD